MHQNISADIDSSGFVLIADMGLDVKSVVLVCGQKDLADRWENDNSTILKKYIAISEQHGIIDNMEA